MTSFAQFSPPKLWYATCQAHPYSVDPNIWWGLQIMQVLIMKYSSASPYFIPFGPKHIPQHPFKHRQAMLFS
jgi:hypothetical protein